VDPVCELNKVLGDNPGAAKVDHSLEAEPHCKKRAWDEEEHHDPAAHDIPVKIGFQRIKTQPFYRNLNVSSLILSSFWSRLKVLFFKTINLDPKNYKR
jgi:hypothetical protein